MLHDREIAQLKAAIDGDDLDQVQALLTGNPELHRAPLGYGKNGPLTQAAQCPAPPSPARLEIARWMIEHGSDVHQGGDGPLMRAALNDGRIPMMALLVAHGADVNALWGGHYPIICAPCESLAPKALQWLLEHGASPRPPATKNGTPLQMLISTYSRNPDGKHACLEVIAAAGYSLPDTPTMAVHRGRVDLLEEHFQREEALVDRRFREEDIWPPELGIQRGDGLHTAPLDGAPLLHIAIEYQERAIVRWLLDQGADPNARTLVDADGFGGHTPLFQTVLKLGYADETIAPLLLARGGDPNARATLRKQLRYMGDPEREKMHEYHDVTPLEFARRFQEQGWINQPAVAAIAAAGGT